MHKDKKQYNLLVVEDNEGDYFLIKDYLEEMIVAPLLSRAKSFYETCEVLENKQGQLDVILLDLSLPDKNGLELIVEVLALELSIPVIVLTGYTDFSFAVTSLGMGISDYLLKDDLTATTLYKSLVYNIERQKSIKNLKDSEQRYADLFHLSPQPMWVIDQKGLNFLDVNEAAIRDYGFSYEEFLKMDFPAFYSNGDTHHSKFSFETESSIPKNHYLGTFTLAKKGNYLIKVDIWGNAIKFKEANAVVLLAHDITERINHVNAIEKQNKLLREIAWTQSHIVRAPLARILGLINLINDEAVRMDEKIEMIQHLAASAHELDEIVIDITKKAQKIIPQNSNDDFKDFNH